MFNILGYIWFSNSLFWVPCSSQRCFSPSPRYSLIFWNCDPLDKRPVSQTHKVRSKNHTVLKLMADCFSYIFIYICLFVKLASILNTSTLSTLHDICKWNFFLKKNTDLRSAVTQQGRDRKFNLAHPVEYCKYNWILFRIFISSLLLFFSFIKLKVVNFFSKEFYF